MRFNLDENRRQFRSDLQIEFCKQDLSSYSGLELFRRYFRLIKLHKLIQKVFQHHQLSGDYSIVNMLLVFFVLWLTGGKRLSHIQWINDDPLARRLCELNRMPSERTLSRWLKQFTADTLKGLISLNSEIVVEKLKDVLRNRITLDFDGTVLSCGDTIEKAARGYNPQNRHAKSYYPLLCHVAQTGHFLEVLNRPGNNHDSKGGALEMIRGCIEKIRKAAPQFIIEARLDCAFFTDEIVEYFENNHIEFAFKVPLWEKLGIKQEIIKRQRWFYARPDLKWFKTAIFIKKWKRNVEIIIFRHRLSKTKRKEMFQLDLFSPDDGVYEYSVICSNKLLHPKNIFDFYNGRAAMERQISELKNEFAFDSIPTNHFYGNSAYQKISVLTYNLIRNYQLDVGEIEMRKKTRKRTFMARFQSLKSIRFQMIAAAGRITNTDNKKVLRLNANSQREFLFKKITAALTRLAA